jgi:hypothetical protein
MSTKAALNRQDVNLSQLAGMDSEKLSRVVQQQIGIASADIYNRPNEKKPREVTIKLKFAPADDEGDRVLFEFEVSGKTPPRKSKSYGMENNGAMKKMVFNDITPGDDEDESQEGDDDKE